MKSRWDDPELAEGFHNAILLNTPRTRDGESVFQF